MKQERTQSTNKMGTEPVKKVLLSMGIPMILSMVLQACYNIVDSMFVARIPDSDGIVDAGEHAVHALTLAFPVQMLIVAFAIGTGVGVNALLARTLGANDRKKVAKIAGNGISLGIMIYLIFLILGVAGIDAYLESQTKDIVTLGMGKQYLKICTCLCLGNVMFGIYEKLLQSTGKSVFSTAAQIAGAVTNIILDPVLIFGLLGAPQLGIAGAAWATVIGQFVSMIVAGGLHHTKNKEVAFQMSYLKPKASIIKEIYQIGLPAIIMQALMSFMTYGINLIFGAVSAGAVTAYGIFYKLQQFLFFAGFGLRDAITPIVSFNYGMRKKKRVKQGIFYGIFYTEIIMALGIIVLEIFAEPLVGFFHLTDHTARLCVLAIRIIAPGFLFAGGNIAMQGVFQAMESGLGSLVVSLLRLLVVVLPCAWWFSTFANAEFMIWFAFPIAEMAAFLAAICFLIPLYRK